MDNTDRIGLFGGSFDPVHAGHLILAQMAADFAGLDRVLFIPTSSPPHKTESELAPYSDRVEMVKLAIEGNSLFEVSMIESGERPSYTWQSVARFTEAGYTRDRLHLIVGNDSLAEMAGWRKPELIFAGATIISMARPGNEETPALPDGSAVIVIEAGFNAISSSEIRTRIREGRSIRYLVPDAVERYIRDRDLYIDNR